MVWTNNTGSIDKGYVNHIPFAFTVSFIYYCVRPACVYIVWNKQRDCFNIVYDMNILLYTMSGV
jgi:uncharacterized membrane protein